MAGPDLEGASSISVAVRVRPFTIREAAQLSKTDDAPLFLGDGSLAGAQTPKLASKGLRSIIKVVDDRCLVFDPPEDNPVQRFSKTVLPGSGKRVKDQTFCFDKVFDENTAQGDVYESTSKNLLDNVLNGYNATVFAYGATGCGKTHTITGSMQQPGIIFLTMQELFEKIADVQEDKVTEISLSYLEIYNETIRDLLVPGGSKGGLMLREDANHAVSVAGLSSHHPQNVQEVMDMIVRGNECRTQSPTEANATSSRSHAVLQINVSQKDRNADINEPHTMATLSIIDLAGSERASATKNRGERLTEGANINKSLLALGSCINALCDPRRKNHIPYRNSKLTRLLKFSLGGNCKTVMIVCVSPSSAHFDETQNTLRYANRAKNIQTKVTRNVYNVNRHVKDFLKKIDEQMTLINELKAQQKDYETIAFGKFKKQSEKKEGIIREGVARLRSSYDHCQADRQERVSAAKKLRQIERRIAALSSWIAAFDYTCEAREESEPPQNLLNMRKTANGILMELEQSRSHYHSRLAKASWQRPIDTALQTGLKQLEEVDGVIDNSDREALQREAELLKSNAETEMQSAVLELDKQGDNALMQTLLRAHFETICMIDQVLTMDEASAMRAGKDFLHRMLNACNEATNHVVKADGSQPVLEPLPRTKSGTPKRRRDENLVRSSPMKRPSQAPPIQNTARFSMSPAKGSSPRRRVKLGTPRKGVSFTPKKRSPAKRAVRWRDDTEDGTLAEWSQTPQKQDSTPAQPSSESTQEMLPPKPQPDYLHDSDNNSSPMPTPPSANMDTKPKNGRFQTGFLSRKGNDSPHSKLANPVSSSPEASPLQEVALNKANGRPSSEMPPPPPHSSMLKENISASSSDSTDDETRQVKAAIKRASMSRRQSMRDADRIHRRRSPPNPNTYSPSENHETSLFSTTHARRMKAERDPAIRHSTLSPRTTPVVKQDVVNARRNTMSDERPTPRQVSRGSSGPWGKVSVNPGLGAAVPGNRGSLAAKPKSVWR
ncbi:MAG: hypothetical protein Q9159_006184 [Coniocarpon cinnabarinum]